MSLYIHSASLHLGIMEVPLLDRLRKSAHQICVCIMHMNGAGWGSAIDMTAHFKLAQLLGMQGTGPLESLVGFDYGSSEDGFVKLRGILVANKSGRRWFLALGYVL